MDLAYVGYFSKVHGIKGQLVLRIEHDFLVDEAKALFVETTSGKAPYFVSGIKENKSGLIISLEDLDAVEKARSLTGKKVFVDSKFIVEEEADFNWLGYALIDAQHGPLGVVSDVTYNGAQILLTLTFKEKEILLPLVEDFIEQIDEAGKKLYFNAPEGLIDVYLAGEE